MKRWCARIVTTHHHGVDIYLESFNDQTDEYAVDVTPIIERLFVEICCYTTNDSKKSNIPIQLYKNVEFHISYAPLDEVYPSHVVAEESILVLV